MPKRHLHEIAYKHVDSVLAFVLLLSFEDLHRILGILRFLELKHRDIPLEFELRLGYQKFLPSRPYYVLDGNQGTPKA